jgi:hypothetical protein
VSDYLLGLSFVVFVANFVYSMWINPKPAPQNPWQSRGLEWQVPTPGPFNNFDRLPVIMADPYHYGEADPLPVADLRGGGALAALAAEGVAPFDAYLPVEGPAPGEVRSEPGPVTGAEAGPAASGGHHVTAVLDAPDEEV